MDFTSAVALAQILVAVLVAVVMWLGQVVYAWEIAAALQGVPACC